MGKLKLLSRGIANNSKHKDNKQGGIRICKEMISWNNIKKWLNLI